MFCVQCEQTIRTPAETAAHTRRGCVVKRRKPLTFGVYSSRRCKGLSAWAVKAREYGIINHDVTALRHVPFLNPDQR